MDQHAHVIHFKHLAKSLHACPSLRGPCKQRKEGSVAGKQKGRNLNWRTNVVHLSSAEKAGQNLEGGKYIFFELVYSILFENQAKMHDFQ